MPSKLRRRATVAVAVCLLTALNIGIFIARTSSEEPVQEGTGDIAIRIQRERTQAFKETLASESLDDVIQNLDREIDFVFPGYISQKFMYHADFECVMSNRRVHRLVSLLSQLPKEEAAARAIQICDKMYELQNSAVQSILANARDGSVPANTRALAPTRLAFGAGVFALAHWAEPKKVFVQLIRLETLARRMASKLERENLRSHEDIVDLVQSIRLDNTFKVNVVLYSATHGPSPRDSKLEEEMLKATAALRKKTVTLVPWDAEVTSYDVIHVAFLRAPIDESKGAEKLIVREFDSTMIYDRQGQLDLVKKLGNICGAVKEPNAHP